MMSQDWVTRITEKRNPATMELDQLDTGQILQVINEEDAGITTAVAEVMPTIEIVVDKIVNRMKKGGRLFYIGAGTSGRLGILDAVECVPTFSVAPDRVIGILAGGRDAIFAAQENIEDSKEQGSKDLMAYDLKAKDTVLGIAASGKTPYVLGAVTTAHEIGALVIGLACTKDSPLEKSVSWAITPIVGPEVVTGSTRMKAGTAQKMVLNMISTTVMIKLGKVYSNLMVDLKASNQKLRERSERIFMTVTGADQQIAADYLGRADYSVKEAIVMFAKGCTLERAEELLKENDEFLRRVIE